MTTAPDPENAAGTLRPLAYGNVAVDDWGAPGAAEGAVEPWASFDRARQLWHQGHTDEAAGIWRQLASTPGLESRQTLQAWHFLRLAGQLPPPERAKRALGVIAEVPVNGGHDLLAAYQDGSARYLNHAGGATIVEGAALAGSLEAITTWMAVGQDLANAIGPWEKPDFPPLPPGNLRVMVLTPVGPHFGQGPYDVLAADKRVEVFVSAATVLLQIIVAATA
jgi:hypothetical protein